MKPLPSILALLGLSTLAFSTAIPRDETNPADHISSTATLACKENQTKCADLSPGGAVFVCVKGAWVVLQACRSSERCVGPTPHCTWGGRLVEGETDGVGVVAREVDVSEVDVPVDTCVEDFVVEGFTVEARTPTENAVTTAQNESSPTPTHSASDPDDHDDSSAVHTAENAVCRACHGLFTKCMNDCYGTCIKQCNAQVCQTPIIWRQTCKTWCRWPCS